MQNLMGARSRVRQGTIILVLIVSFVVVVAPTSLAALSRSHAGGKVVVRIAYGGIAGRGRFTARGAITDKGTTTTYRWVKGSLITLRTVALGTKGKLVFVVTIDTTANTSRSGRWTIASGTRAYKGLHGHGTETENADYTVSVLTGTVSR